MELAEDYISLVFRKSYSKNSQKNAEKALKRFETFSQSKYYLNIIGLTLAIKNGKLNAYDVLNKLRVNERLHRTGHNEKRKIR